MDIERYINEHDEDCPMLTAHVGNPDVREALEEEQAAMRERRVGDVRQALGDLRARSTALQGSIKRTKDEAKNVRKRLDKLKSGRDINRMALALLVTDNDITTAQRFGLYAILSAGYVLHSADNLKRIGAIYGVEYALDGDATKLSEDIANAAKDLVPSTLLEELQASGV